MQKKIDKYHHQLCIKFAQNKNISKTSDASPIHSHRTHNAYDWKHTNLDYHALK